jgi:hypothetical protein
MRRTCLAVLVILPLLASAQYNRPGSSDAQFMKIGISPRGTAMSDAYIAAVNGAEATFYNSAALPWTQGTDAVFNHTVWFAGISHDFVAVTRNFDDFGTIGVSATALRTDEMKVTTPLQPNGTGETFYAGNYRFGLSYARFLTDRVTFGATVNYIYMALYQSFNARAFSIDIAAMYVSDFRGFRFGMQIANFGSEVKYVNESYPLPTTFNFGLAMNAIDGDDHKVLVSVAGSKPNEGAPLAQIGLEYGFSNTLFLRAGRHFNYSAADYSFGGGVRIGVVGIQLHADYSYSSFLTLGAAHRFGFGVAF